ncbi:aldehyde dehydrogenase domain-containing protein [Thelonectria olida]|uniref:aldehyde dehydrogenase (NAD(+)) n=1 Tax=Thelonectria olida TaxID=1576542 RepID=A0A9P8VS70_9HYPO|nr:aldehyde dehydrogenase domain-containing protein [Thelonectria olida]
MPPTVQISLPNGQAYAQPTGLFINNEFVDASGDEFTVINPATEQCIIKLHGASSQDIGKAVHSADTAFEGPWADLAAGERGALLYKIAALIDRDRDLLAAIDAYDNDKPFTAAQGDIEEAYQVFRYYAGAADKISGRTIETSNAKLAYVLQEPLGVCGQIIPWNFPFMMLAWKFGPALACGNTVILKPAEQTPLSALYFGNLLLESGLPAGAVNLVPGLGPVAGKAIAGHTGIAKVAFTGSTSTGRAIMKSAATNLKNITLECGGKSPLIVFDDADLEQAAKWAHLGTLITGFLISTVIIFP